MPSGVYERRICRICSDPRAAEINFRLVAGDTVKRVAETFGYTHDITNRHWNNHVTLATRAEMLGGKQTIANLAIRARAEDRSLMDYCSILRSALLKLFLDAQQKGDRHGATMVAARLQSVLEMTGKITGEIRTADAQQTTVNVGILNGHPGAADTEIARVQACVIKALRSFPDARAAVVLALDQMADESRPAPLSRPPSGNGSTAPLIEHQPQEAQ